jgi:anti-sigma factor RsiW
MACPNLSQELLQAYIDRQLDAREQKQVERHLAACGDCARERDALLALRETLRGGAPYFAAPVGLRERIRSRVARPEPVTPRRLTPMTLLAAAAVLLISLPVGYFKFYEPRHESTEKQVVARHLHSFQPGCRPPFTSSDPAGIGIFFQRTLGYVPPVPSLTTGGFELIGARIDFIKRRPVGALLYQQKNHIIQLFVWPQDKNITARKNMTVNGRQIVHWSDQAWEFWAISDLSAQELQKFAALYQETTDQMAIH